MALWWCCVTSRTESSRGQHCSPHRNFTQSSRRRARTQRNAGVGLSRPRQPLREHRPGTLIKHAAYLHSPTAGRIGSLSHLIREAVLIAITEGAERITKQLLGEVELDAAAETQAWSTRPARRTLGHPGWHTSTACPYPTARPGSVVRDAGRRLPARSCPPSAAARQDGWLRYARADSAAPDQTHRPLPPRHPRPVRCRHRRRRPAEPRRIAVPGPRGPPQRPGPSPRFHATPRSDAGAPAGPARMEAGRAARQVRSQLGRTADARRGSRRGLGTGTLERAGLGSVMGGQMPDGRARCCRGRGGMAAKLPGRQRRPGHDVTQAGR